MSDAKNLGDQWGSTDRVSSTVAGAPCVAPGMPACIDGVLCDGLTAAMPVYDDGLLRGDGAFEYLRCYAGRPFMLLEHLDRLEHSCRVLRLPFPRSLLENEIAELLAWGITPGYQGVTDLRIVLTRGGRRMIFLEPACWWGPTEVALVTDSPRVILAGAKSLSYAGNMLARRVAEERGSQDALLVTPDGRVTEAQQAAFFWTTPQGELCTPPLTEGILDSITRRVVLKRLSVCERVCRKEDVFTAVEAFLAGTPREIQPVKRIENYSFDGVPGEVTRRAIAAFRQEVQEQLKFKTPFRWPDSRES